jgi:predicted O-methyltransferase YrrM
MGGLASPAEADVSEEEIPQLVQRATALAERLGFEQSSIPEVGRLLRGLAGTIENGVIGETGTGCGVGSAWIVSGLRPTTRLVTVEIDAGRAAATRELFAELENVVVLNGDWKEIGYQGPFDMLFLDGGGKRREQEISFEMLKPGGFAVLDDMTPESQWPEEWRRPDFVDEVREWWFGHPELATIEILTTPKTSAIIAIRLPNST